MCVNKKCGNSYNQRMRLHHQHLLLASGNVHAGGQRAAIKKKEKYGVETLLF
jgi:hypothetical protein